MVLDEHAAAQLDDQTGYQRDGVAVNRNRPPGGTDYSSTAAAYAFRGQAGPDVTYGGGGGGSRFFPVFRYCPKAPARERPSYERKGAPEPVHHRSASYRCITCGRQAVNVPGSACACPDPQLAPDPAKAGRVVHPTVKPLTLISWLVRLVTPPGGVVLEPFAGSGTTVEACLLEGFGCVAVEADAEYLPLIDQRIARANATLAARPQPDLFGGGAA